MAEATHTTVQVRVVRAWPDHVWQVELELPQGATVASALVASGLSVQWPDFDPWVHGVAVFGVLRPAGFVLRHGDRIEILRPLRFDPMESRRRRARHKAARRRQAAVPAA